MATLPVTAVQVGTYFVGQYYQMLQIQPELVHQFYTNESTMLRIDGSSRETATAMLQIHQLVMSLNYKGVEIKTIHSLESWRGGVLVTVTGYADANDFNGRNFTETFFLAPQENGYFVLNNILQYVDEEWVPHHPISYLPQSSFGSELSSSAALQEQVPSYMLSGDIQSRVFVHPLKVEENGQVNHYNYSDEQLRQDHKIKNRLDDNFHVQSNGSLQRRMNSVSDYLSLASNEPVVEPQKHTYASIVAKLQSAPAVSSRSSSNKSGSHVDLQHLAEPTYGSFSASTNPIKRSSIETMEDASAHEDEVEVKSVYVKNVPTSITTSEIAEVFKKFGTLMPDGVAIRTRKDVDGCFAFVEFKDISGVHNAIKASTVQIGRHQLYIEGRRPNRSIPTRGGRASGRNWASKGSRGRYELGFRQQGIRPGRT